MILLQLVRERGNPEPCPLNPQCDFMESKGHEEHNLKTTKVELCLEPLSRKEDAILYLDSHWLQE